MPPQKGQSSLAIRRAFRRAGAGDPMRMEPRTTGPSRGDQCSASCDRLRRSTGARIDRSDGKISIHPRIPSRIRIQISQRISQLAWRWVYRGDDRRRRRRRHGRTNRITSPRSEQVRTRSSRQEKKCLSSTFSSPQKHAETMDK